MISLAWISTYSKQHMQPHSYEHWCLYTNMHNLYSDIPTHAHSETHISTHTSIYTYTGQSRARVEILLPDPDRTRSNSTRTQPVPVHILTRLPVPNPYPCISWQVYPYPYPTRHPRTQPVPTRDILMSTRSLPVVYPYQYVVYTVYT